MPTAAIFDCDGVLIDSANVWRETERELCLRAGRLLDEEEERAIVTMTIEEAAGFIHERVGLGESGTDVVRMIDELMFDFYAYRALPLPGISNLLAGLSERGVAMSVVSSSPKPYLIAGLERIGLADMFQTIVSVDDLGSSKREPKPFLHALDSMGALAEDAWGFDDSYYAVQTMRGMGMCTIGVYDAENPYELDCLREASHLLTCDYASLDLDMLAAGPRAFLLR